MIAAQSLHKLHNAFLPAYMCLLVILTNLSQMPTLVDAGITQFLSVPAWIILFLYCFFTKRFPRVQAFWLFFSLSVFFALFYLTASALDEAYSRTALPSVIFLATFILLCSSAVARSLDKADIDRVFTCYILSVVVVGWSVYTTYIAVTNELFAETRMYLYDAKNSISQILLSAWILILFTKMGTRFWLRMAYILIFLLLTYEILMLQSRASIIGMPIALAIAVWNGGVSKNTRLYACIIIFAILVALSYSGIFNYVRDFILFAGRNADNLNDISSGRSLEWVEFPALFEQHPFWGIGRCKRESLILTSLLEFGIIGGVPILLMAILPLNFVFKAFSVMKNDPVFITFIVVVLVYLLNGVFEQLAPFGPGAKCFFMWFLYGILATKYYDGKSRRKIC